MDKPILLKLSGEVFSLENTHSIISDIAKLTCKLGIVIGGGNFFRGDIQGKKLGLEASSAHHVGMLATMMNGVILQQLLKKAGKKSVLFSSLACPQIAETLSQQGIDRALSENKIIIFAGGLGNPFFTTDTNAVVKALQIGACEIWKATNVDGLYEQDPKNHPDAKLLKKVTYKVVLEKSLKVMDLTAITLASENHVKIRVFNMKNLAKVAHDNNLGSIIVAEE